MKLPPTNEVVCIDSIAFRLLIDTVIQHIEEKHNLPAKEWISTEEAMDILGVKSKTTLQTLRDTGQIKFTQPMRKLVLYNRPSLLDYLEKHAKSTF